LLVVESPNAQFHAFIVPGVTVEPSVNSAESGQKVVNPNAATGKVFTYMFFVIVSEQPALVLTINVTGWKPATSNVSVGSCMAEVPLLKVHAHEVIVPVVTLEESVNVIVEPRQAFELT
jgi:hypothetical protein